MRGRDIAGNHGSFELATVRGRLRGHPDDPLVSGDRFGAFGLLVGNPALPSSTGKRDSNPPIIPENVFTD